MVRQLAQGGHMNAASILAHARSVLNEARARLRACPWCARNAADVELAEARLFEAVNLYTAASDIDRAAYDACGTTATGGRDTEPSRAAGSCAIEPYICVDCGLSTRNPNRVCLVCALL